MTDTLRASGLTRRDLLGGLAAGGALIGLEGCGGDRGPQLNFYNWDTYIGDTTLADFQKAAGVRVTMSLFANNDELFAKLRGGNQGYDVIVPSNDTVERLARAGMLLPLDHAKLPNFANVAPEFRDPEFDRGRRYSMPYTWLVTGIGYRKSKVDGVPDSWKWVLDSDRYRGRIALLAESADLCRLSQLYLGAGAAPPGPELLQRIEAMLVRQKPNVALFHDDNGQDLLLAGDVDLAIEYSGDIAQAMKEDDDIGFVVPREGSQINSDCLCIPKGAPNPALAHRFIDFLLDGRVGAGISRTIRYPTPNAAAKALMPADYRDDPVIFPAPDVLRRCHYFPYAGEDMARRYEEVATRVRAA